MQPHYRRCVSCRQIRPKQEFWRVVRLFPDHTIQLDIGIGRSAYLCQNEDCLSLARKKGRLSRALKAPVDEKIYQLLSQRLDEIGKR